MQVAMSVLTNRFALSQFLIKLIWMYFLPSPLMTRNHFLHGPHLKAGMVAMFWAMRNAWSMFYSVVVLVARGMENHVEKEKCRIQNRTLSLGAQKA